MSTINSPIRRSESGPAVADLQNALLFLLQKAPTFLPATERPALIAGLQTERSTRTYGETTTQIILLFQRTTAKQFRLPITGDVDDATAAALNSMLKELGASDAPAEPLPTPSPATPVPTDLRVQGQVQFTDGRPQRQAMVQAFDVDLRHKELLGKTTTDERGHYSISYTAEQFKRAEKKNADLLLRVLNEKGETLVESPIVFNAKAEETIDLLLGGTVLIGPSEYSRLTTDVEPTLDGVAPADLTEQDIDFLTGETGWSREYLGFYANAARLSQQTQLPTEVFYGFARQKLPTDLPRLLAEDQSILRRALEAALSENIIPASIRDSLDKIMARLKELHIDQAFIKPQEGEKASLGQVIATVVADPKLQRDLVTLHANHQGTPEEFWAKLRENPTHAASVDALQFTLRLSSLTGNHLPLVTALQKQQADGKVQKLQDLVRYEPEDWQKLLSRTGVPSETPGERAKEKAANYATTLARTLREAFPTAAVAHSITREAKPDQAELAAFFTNNPDFDLSKTHIDAFLANDAPAVTDGITQARVSQGTAASLDGIKDKVQLTQDLKAMQRVFRLTPDYAQMRTLLDSNLHSAQSISRMGESSFVSQFSTSIGPAQAQQIYAVAAQTSATALTLFANFSPAFNLSLAAINGTNQEPAPSLPGVPDLETLFGSLDLCDCEHCRTVLSPAAYLVDILSFLKHRPLLEHVPETDPPETKVIPNQWVKGILDAHRPDIERIELTCENTNTPLPYVDLVNEILEDAVAPPTTPTNRQTSGTAAELAANPQYQNDAAYDTLATAVYPWTMPFDMAHDEVHTYLDHLGVPRHELMRTFQDPAGPSDESIAADYLGINRTERKIITNTLSPARQPWEFWGHPANNAGNWPMDLRSVRKFLDVSGLSYAELTDLLTTHFVNPDADIKILADDPKYADTCDTTKLVITNDTDNLRVAERTGFLDRLHRFVRLWRNLGWTAQELDHAITALQPEITEQLLLSISHIQQLRSNFKFSVDQILAFWSNINTSGPDSLYRKLFQNPMVLKPVVPEFAINATTSDVAGAADLISRHEPAILAALRISSADLSALQDAPVHLTGFAEPLSALNIPPSAFLSLHNLTRLYRISLLAKALKLTIPNLLILADLTGLNPFDAAKTEDTIRVVELAAKIKSSGFSISELNYLLRHEASATSPIPPSEKSITTVLEDIRKGLQKIDAEMVLVPDLTGEFTKKCLGLLNWTDAEIDPFIVSLNETTKSVVTYPPAPAIFPAVVISKSPYKDRLSFDSKTLAFTFAGLMSVTAKTVLLAHSSDPAYQTAVNDLYDESRKPVETATQTFLTPADVSLLLDPPISVAARFELVLTRLLAYLTPRLKTTMIKQKLSDALKLESDVTEQLLTQRIKARTDPILWSIEDFRVPAFAESDVLVPISAAGFPKQFDSFTLLHKTATVLRKCNVTIEELSWLFDLGPTVGWLNLNELPVALNPGSTAAHFEGWSRLVDLFELRDALPSGSSVLSAIFIAARTTAQTTQPLLGMLSSNTLWNRTDLTALDGSTGFNLSVTDYTNERALSRLVACFAILKRLGASASQCLAWAKEPATSAEAHTNARNAKQVARAKYDDDQWLAIAKPLRDVMREKQRDALVSYLVAHPNASAGQHWKDANGLYEHFLIDVEMCPCQFTSRIKQACASVQLFVQRCLMGLEPAVLADATTDTHWLEWKWMKLYRVWEANRKVFLYPENWIEPDLRDGKSPFFKDLENDLMQNEVTKDTAEQALLNYLEKLDTVAKLEIVGMYTENEPGVDIIHVFGRTQTSPHRYFYRKRVDSVWTPWEKVDLDIEGDHLIPVVWNRRLCLFWPIFTEKSKKDMRPDHGFDEDEKFRIKYWSIQLAWSEFKNGKWGAKAISKAALDSEEIGIFVRTNPIDKDKPLGKTSFTFKGFVTDEGLMIRVIYQYSDPVHYYWYDTASFILAGCNREPEVRRHFPANRWLALDQTTASNMRFVEKSASSNALTLLEQPVFANIPTLSETPGQFEILPPHQDAHFTAAHPFFFHDNSRVFFVSRKVNPPINHFQNPNLTALEASPNNLELLAVGHFAADTDAVEDAPSMANSTATALPVSTLRSRYLFQPFYHPYLCPLIRELNRNGIDGVMRRKVQIDPERTLMPQPQTFDFNAVYEPQPVVAKPYPVEEIDFSYRGAYASYNWELFFHVPLLIADRLSKNQRFEEAQQWFHYIFDPTDASSYPSPQKYWQTGHFFRTSSAKNRAEQIQALMQRLASGAPDFELEAQVDQWRKFPFNPHLIARLRTTAYQKKVVMSYIDNLIAWGDQLFRRDTIESLNEATQLYVMASEILGRPPEKIKARLKPAARTFKTLESDLDSFSNALVQVENVVATVLSTGTHTGPGGSSTPLTLPSTLYFCIPKNDKLLGYWDTVADRLFKLRHCMNIEGVVRQLPLFEPPIDPALLVRAAAAGLDISSALNDINAALPHYRFNVMSQKTSELCGELKSLGGALLSALEKRDAEAVALLRSSQELNVLVAARQVRQRQVDEAKEGLEGAKKSREVVEVRHQYYRDIMFYNPGEEKQLKLSGDALSIQDGIAKYQLVGNLVALIPNVKAGLTDAGFTFGGSNIGGAVNAFAAYLEAQAGMDHTRASLSGTRAGFERRWEDWKLQERTSAKELEQQDRQILAAEIRLKIAELELENHDRQVENAKEMDRYMRDKFTNRELYDWMVSQISGIYFQCYQLSYDLAKRAERAYRFELGLADSNFIQFGYWDSMKKGLLSGERLSFDLKRMEAAYLDKNKREFELTKTISLVLLDPMALLKLRETGDCFIDLPEDLFDRDFPGHYLRRIKSVSLTIPCVTGPYTGVHATLTLVKNSVRKSSITTAPYERDPNDDPRFTDSVGAIQSIATSTGQNDSGLFELNFRDERYLPFEGTGVISQWRLQLPPGSNAFDFDTISDVILHLKYAARDGGDTLRNLARPPAAPSGEFARLFSMKHEFPTEWHRLLNPHGAQTQSVTIELSKDRFPYQFQGRTIQVNRVDLFLKPHLPSNVTLPLSLTFDPLTIPPPPKTTFALTKHSTMPELLHATMPFQSASTGPWQLASSTTLPPEAVEDLWILVHFQES